MNFRRQVGSSSGSRGGATVDMTPVVDTFFNLMIFFFFTATFTQEQLQPKLDVDLPKSPSSVMARTREDLAIVIRRGGQLEVEGRPLDLTQLEARLVRYRRQDPQGGILIQADQKVPHGRVVRVMGLVDKLKIKRLSIGVQQQ